MFYGFGFSSDATSFDDSRFTLLTPKIPANIIVIKSNKNTASLMHLLPE
jgi:hypothetical protein